MVYSGNFEIHHTIARYKKFSSAPGERGPTQHSRKFETQYQRLIPSVEDSIVSDSKESYLSYFAQKAAAVTPDGTTFEQCLMFFALCMALVAHGVHTCGNAGH
jgi:hypothetical protein